MVDSPSPLRPQVDVLTMGTWGYRLGASMVIGRLGLGHSSAAISRPRVGPPQRRIYHLASPAGIGTIFGPALGQFPRGRGKNASVRTISTNRPRIPAVAAVSAVFAPARNISIRSAFIEFYAEASLEEARSQPWRTIFCR